MLGEWYDAKGQVVETSWSRRRIGLGLEELRGLDNVVGVAGGVDKVAAISGAIASRLVSALLPGGAAAGGCTAPGPAPTPGGSRGARRTPPREHAADEGARERMSQGIHRIL